MTDDDGSSLLWLSAHSDARENIALLRSAIIDPDRSPITKVHLTDYQSPEVDNDVEFIEALQGLFNHHHHPPLESVEIEGGANFIPSDIGTTTKVLILRNVALQRDETISKLERYNNNNKSLVSLSLLSMSLSTPLVTVLTNNMNFLETLDLSDSRFLGEDLSILSNGLRNFTSLKSFCVSECNLMNEQIEQIAVSLRDHPSLKELNISFNKCRSSGMFALAQLLTSSTPLVKLGMSFLAFGAAKQIELKEFCTALASNETLKELELGGNSLRDGDLPYLVEALCSSKSKLQSLDLSQNRFEDLSSFALRLGEMKHLRWLSIEDNRLTENSLDALLDAFSSTTTGGSNFVLEDIEMDNVVEANNAKWRMLHYHLDLNWAGRRFLSRQDGNSISIKLWPLIIERSNNLNNRNDGDGDTNTNNQRLTRKPVSKDIIYYYLRTFPALTSMAKP